MVRCISGVTKLTPRSRCLGKSPWVSPLLAATGAHEKCSGNPDQYSRSFQMKAPTQMKICHRNICTLKPISSGWWFFLLNTVFWFASQVTLFIFGQECIFANHNLSSLSQLEYSYWHPWPQISLNYPKPMLPQQQRKIMESKKERKSLIKLQLIPQGLK